MTDRELLDRKGHEVNDDLPPLPEPVEVLELWGNDCPVYNREQMRAYATAYARAAVLAERERHSEIVLQELGDTGQARAIAAAIREGWRD